MGSSNTLVNKKVSCGGFRSSLVEPITDLESINKMSEILAEQSDRNYLLFVIGINLGLRVSDYTQLDIGFYRKACERGVVELIPSKTDKREPNENGCLVGQYKIVRLPIPKDLKNTIEEYIKGKDSDDYMFPSRKGGTPIRRETVWTILNDAAADAGLEINIGCHSMRKTFGYWHYKYNNDIHLLMEIFQHSSESMTLKYIGVTGEDIENSMNNMKLGIRK